MTETVHRLCVVRKDGISHSSDFSGWHSEPAAFRYFNEAKEDKQTLYAAVLARPVDYSAFSARAEWSRMGEDMATAMRVAKEGELP